MCWQYWPGAIVRPEKVEFGTNVMRATGAAAKGT
jgi:hypothetical protein